MVSALEHIKKRLHPRRPLRVQTDKGSEFYKAAVENTSTHQIVPKILLSLMSTILSPQCNNETEQQSFSANSISLLFFKPRGP